MTPRLFLAITAICCASPAYGWRVSVKPPRPDLPVVELELGYPGDYVPKSFCPVTLRARAGERPFDGYVGFRVMVGGRYTLDIPMAVRTRLASGGASATETTLTLAGYGNDSEAPAREIFVEWRRSDLTVIRSAAAGVPSWTRLKPLHVERLWSENAVMLPRGNLAPQAQWYRAFHQLFIATKDWLALPQRVRKAIFHSGITVVFYGLPGGTPKLTAIDREMLPVTFGARVEPRSGAQYLGQRENPELVFAGSSWFVQDQRWLEQPLPAIAPRHSFGQWNARAPGAAQIPPLFNLMRHFAAPLLAALALIASLILWILLRRGKTVPVLLVLALLPLATLSLWRAIARPDSGTVSNEVWNESEGTTRHSSHDLRYARDRVAARFRQTDDAIVFDSTVWGGSGLVEVIPNRASIGDSEYAFTGWASSNRSRTSRVSQSPALLEAHVVRMAPQELTIDYTAAEAGAYLGAVWVLNGRRSYGAMRLRERSGRATVRNGHYVRSPYSQVMNDWEGDDDSRAVRHSGFEPVWFEANLESRRHQVRSRRWMVHVPTRNFLDYALYSSQGQFVIPDDPLPDDGKITVVVDTDPSNGKDVTAVIRTDSGLSQTMTPLGNTTGVANQFTFTVPIADARPVFRPHSLVTVNFQALDSKNGTIPIRPESVDLRVRGPQ